MLKSDNSNPDLNDCHDKSMDILDIKMQQSLDSLNHIHAMLNIKNLNKHRQSVQNQRIKELEQDLHQLHTKLALKDTQIDQTKKALQLAQHEYVQMKQSLNDQTGKYETELALWKTKNEETLKAYKHDIDVLEGKNKTMEGMISQFQELHDRQVDRKDQIELLLNEKAKELQISMNQVLERDQKLDEFQQNIRYMQQMMDEKDESLESYTIEAQLRTQEYNELQDKYEKLEQENHRIKRRLSNLNQLYHSQSQEPALAKSPSQDQQLPSEINSVSIPPAASVLDHHPYMQEINRLQEKLTEKISQNRELESVMERVNEHSEILRTSLNECREESADRYRKMLGYMEDIRILKQELDYAKNASI